MYTTHLHTGHYWTRNYNTSKRLYRLVSYQIGHSTNYTRSSSKTINLTTTPGTTTTPIRIPIIPTTPKTRNITIVVPYIKGTSEMFKRICKSNGIQVHFKGTNTLRTQLVNPKDKDPKLQKSGIIYHYKCPHLNSPEDI